MSRGKRNTRSRAAAPKPGNSSPEGVSDAFDWTPLVKMGLKNAVVFFFAQAGVEVPTGSDGTESEVEQVS